LSLPNFTPAGRPTSVAAPRVATEQPLPAVRP
jgi:hypothetical protein